MDKFHFPSSSYATCISLMVLLVCRGASGATFTLINRCEFTVWPGALANAGSTPLESTGFSLESGTSRALRSPSSWSGRFWGRTGCSFDPATGQLVSCLTGDCRSGQVECNGAGAQPPVTLAEFTVGSPSSSSGAGAGAALPDNDYYDVSLVDGYNLPVLVETSGGSGLCLSTGCVMDMSRACPAELRDSSGEACRSACEAFGSPEYCCAGVYASPDSCKPSAYSEMFKVICPRSYSYAYDDSTSIFTCSGADYTITFCPSLSQSQKPAVANNASWGAEDSGGSGTNPAYTTSSDKRRPWLPNFATGGAVRNLPRDLYSSLLFIFLHSYLVLVCV
ncbi:hypothetical protein SAY86_010666 [Trapa natans]|uniref:Thaumatin-like protein 1b n=1 Tax=Trapa natans TaxID=22666 RepID=A0AAN7LU83_TRANT|nr:hypothetical protein SAY86_010666 [Trapa natans]